MIARLQCSLMLACAALLAQAADRFDYGLMPQKIADNSWAFIGKTEDITRANGGNIVNTAFVVTRRRRRGDRQRAVAPLRRADAARPSPA
jgi:hypothetical protein